MISLLITWLVRVVVLLLPLFFKELINTSKEILIERDEDNESDISNGYA